ncbi:acyltransferase family protein [Flavobacterium sp.]|uniref:acyltransferase family protein n=1 Tax=Flavobacterium sp. TaxID=239 RepID=UPI002FD8AC8D
MIQADKNVSKRVFGLDFLRTISITMVLFSHSSWIYKSSTFIAKVKDMSGFFGVELFFVMSGFLVGRIIYRQFLHESYTAKDVVLFLKRRLARVLPSYYLVILINAVIYLCFGFSLAKVWQYFFLAQNISQPIPPFFPESWSLPIKELSYILAVLVLLFLATFSKKISKQILFLSTILGLILLSLSFKIYFNLKFDHGDLTSWSRTIRSVVIYRMDSVLFGVLIGYVSLNYQPFLNKYKIAFMGLGMLLLFSIVYAIAIAKLRMDNASWFWNVVCMPITSLGIVLFFPILNSWKTAPKRIEKGVQIICDLSYSIYLIHYSIVLFLMKYFIDTSAFSTMQLNFFTLAYLLITLSLSYVFYTYFEKPINNYRRQKFEIDGK